MKTQNRLIVFLALLLLGATVRAQDLFYENYVWDSLAIPQDVAEDKVILFKKKVVEFVHEDEAFVEYDLFHCAELLNSDKEIEQNNKLYIPYRESAEIIKPMARVIQPSGKIIALDESKMLESVDEKTQRKYKFFAFEGLEKGSVIEYMYVVKQAGDYLGVRHSIQEKYPVKRYEFDLIAPLHLEYAFKLYNDTTSIVQDTLYEDRNHWSVILDDVKGLKYEEQAPYLDLLKRLVYKLERNLYTGERDITSYGKASQNVYSNFFMLDKKEEKALSRWMRKIKPDKQLGDEEKIRLIENYLKNNVSIVDFSSPELVDFQLIFENKYASKYGMTRLLANLLKKAGIEIELVLTCDRTDESFDGEFESYHQLQEYLLYFPATGAYLFPTNMYRYGLIPFEYTSNYGLFIREVSVGGFVSGIGKVKYIEPLDYQDTYRNIDVQVSLGIEENKVDLDISNKMFGYSALYYQNAFEVLEGEDREKLAHESIEGLLEHMETENWSVVNNKADLIAQKPLVLNFDGTCNELLENAGNKYIFRIGELIGPQYELYNEQDRELPVMCQFKRMYNHTIVIEIPEGYAVNNLDDLRIQQKIEKEGKEYLKFASDYKLEGNKLTVTIYEFYDELYFDVAEYDNYRTVVNAASDFNKVSLIFEKI